MIIKKIKILVTCFDVSGDHNVAELIRYARTHFTHKFHFIAIAGEEVAQLEANDVELLSSHVVESSIGILEGIPYVLSTLRFFSWFKKYLNNNPVDLLFCVDGQGRNIKLGEIAHNLGIKTTYYFPPQISIYGIWNAKRLKKYFNLILCPFKSDDICYLKQNAPSKFIGHPFGQLALPSLKEKQQYLKKLIKSENNANSQIKLISIFPGSRFQEIKNLLPIFLKSAIKIKHHFPQIEFVISCAHKQFEDLIKSLLKKYWNHQSHLPVISGNWDEILQASYFVIACSGTVTLKASFWGIPHVICYKISFISYWIARFFVKVNYIGMANILAKKEICKELINRNLTVDSIYQYVATFIKDETKTNMLRQQLLSEAKNWKTDNPAKIVFAEIDKLF